MRIFMDRRLGMSGLDILHHNVIACPAPQIIRKCSSVRTIRLEVFLRGEGDDADSALGSPLILAVLDEEVTNLLENLQRARSLLFGVSRVHLEMGRGYNDPALRR